MNDLKGKTCLVYDNGLFHCLAERLARDFKEVYYYVPWESSYPTPQKAIIGKGLPGLTRIDTFDDYAEKADLICFFDIYSGTKQEMLRKRGKRVFGTGKGEKLEIDRVWFREQLKNQGLPVAKYKVVTGIDNLRNYLRPLKDKWVKISKWRGIGETFHFQDYDHTRSEIDSLASKLGSYQDVMPFIVDDPIKGVEVGIDWFVMDGKHLPVGLWGYEAKDAGYVGKTGTYDSIPQVMRDITDNMEEVMEPMGVRGMVSSEIRVNDEPYYTDACMRGPSPPAELMSEIYDNFSEIVWKVAGGEKVVPKMKAKYGAEVLLKSDFARELPMGIKFPGNERLKFRNMCQINGKFYHIPLDKETLIGAAIGMGDTLEEAQSEALEAAESVVAQDVFYDKAVFDDLDETLANAKLAGLGRF